MTPTFTPAYGRDYASKAAVIASLAAGEDFILNDASSCWDGKPCSPLSDFDLSSFRVRDASRRKIWIVERSEVKS